jgi:enoyl-CoA hydratase/carnithine racemase
MTVVLEAEEPVLVERLAQHVALVTLNRPAARNAVNSAVTSAISRIVKELEADPDVWVVILTGAGDHAFCAGADLRQISTGGRGGLATRDGGFAGFVRAERCKPWIAAVNGAALAGGCELALACDMIIAAEDAQFGLPETKRGLAAVAGGLFRLTRAIPRAIAMELIATGRPISSEEAARWGLVNAVVARTAVVDAALTLANTIVANAPIAVRKSLVIARKAFDHTELELFALSDEAIADLVKTEDYKEGPRAFIEKRPAVWVGR